MPIKKAKIVKIRMITIPMISMSGSCEPHFRISCGSLNYLTSRDVRPQSVKNSVDSIYELKLPKPVDVVDDVLIECYNKGIVGNGEKIFQFWFNVSFVGEDGVLIIRKNMLEKAYRDKTNKRFDKNFRIEVELCYDYSGEAFDLPSDSVFIERIMKVTEAMSLVYKKLPLL